MQSNIVRSLIFSAIFAVPALLFNACSCSCDSQTASVLPKEIISKADDFMKSKTGDAFYKKYARFDFQQSRPVDNGYYIQYKIDSGDKDYLVGNIHFSMDSAGNVLTDKEISGIPDCVEQPETCEFNISKEQAIKIAENAGFKKGIKPWKIAFRYDETAGQYIWHILSTFTEFNVGGQTRGDGDELIIDPNSGKIIVQREWHLK